MAQAKRGHDGHLVAAEALTRRAAEANGLLSSIRERLAKLLAQRTKSWAQAGVVGHVVDQLKDADAFLAEHT
jgi:hypothetical protein